MTAQALNFGPVFRARFVTRPNRFLVRCDTRELGLVEAFMPNPGRMWELLLPRATLFLTKANGPKDRKTRYTVLAVERDGAPVFLHTHVNNAVARHLLERGRIAPLKGAGIVRAEAPVGRSRFDFLLHDSRGDIYVEVKSCTLFGNGVAMFPDAVTARGRKHLLELAELVETGHRAAVIFVVHTPHVRWFMPDYHTDLAFSRTLLAVRDRVRVLPVSVNWRDDLTLGRRARLLDIPWDHVAKEAEDRGAYLLILHFEQATHIMVGKLGVITAQPGYHVYVGSAMNGLDARMARHKRRRKRMHWHIDYLRAHATEVDALPIRSSTRDECALADALRAILLPGPEGFGCSDCDCPTHLFFSATPPLHRPDFHTILERFRMKRPWPGQAGTRNRRRRPREGGAP